MQDLTVNDVENALTKFEFHGNQVIGYKKKHSGNINDTLELLLFGTHQHRYILQRLNTYVYKNPEEVMSNITRITEHIKEKVIQAGGDPKTEVLNVIPSKEGKSFYIDDKGNFFRAFRYVDGVAYDNVPTPDAFKQGAIAFGKFQRDLGDFPVSTLYETIKDFHNTKARVAAFEEAVKEDPFGRKKEALDLIDIIKSHEFLASCYDEAIESKKMPLRVTHNDCKMNNVMLDKVTKYPLCVIDLDTCMPGYANNDFGDAIRSGCISSSKKEQDRSKIHIKLDFYKAFLEGFLSETKDTLSQEEIELLPISCLVMTFELGMRYITDYLTGDKYFRPSYPLQNIEKGRNQLYYLLDMEEHLPEMKDILHRVLAEERK